MLHDWIQNRCAFMHNFCVYLPISLTCSGQSAPTHHFVFATCSCLSTLTFTPDVVETFSLFCLSFFFPRCCFFSVYTTSVLSTSEPSLDWEVSTEGSVCIRSFRLCFLGAALIMLHDWIQDKCAFMHNFCDFIIIFVVEVRAYNINLRSSMTMTTGTSLHHGGGELQAV
jgi:hypothetical protein